MRIWADTLVQEASGYQRTGQAWRGLRTLLAFRIGERAFFVFGFAKNERANVVSDKGLVALKLLGSHLLGYDARTLSQALRGRVT